MNTSLCIYLHCSYLSQVQPTANAALIRLGFHKALFPLQHLSVLSGQIQLWLQQHRQSWYWTMVGSACSGLCELTNQSRLGFLEGFKETDTDRHSIYFNIKALFIKACTWKWAEYGMLLDKFFRMQSGRHLEFSGMLQLTLSSLMTSCWDLLFVMSRFLQKAACGILITHAACVCLDPLDWIQFTVPDFQGNVGICYFESS